MALSKSGLKQRIITELQAIGFTTSGQYVWSEKYAEAIANAIVDEIQSNAKAAGADTPGGNTHNLSIT